MSRFVQLHLLTAYPASNLNRDDLGSPKTVIVGGTNRLRISSQSLKRAWRTSSVFEEVANLKNGTRTKRIGTEIILPKFKALGVDDALATKVAEEVASRFGKAGKKNPVDTEQIVFISNDELARIDALIGKIAESKTAPDPAEYDVLLEYHSAPDLALFGRMMADSPKNNVEAAAQVAHAFTVHAAQVQDDYFTAVDDLNRKNEDAGSAHIGVRQFGSGVFYTYVCINTELLVKNLAGVPEANRAQRAQDVINGLVRAAATISPSGMQNSFAAHSRASYVLAESGDEQPRSLAAAFLHPIDQTNLMNAAIDALRQTRDNFDKVYGQCYSSSMELNVVEPSGLTLDELAEYCGKGVA